MKKRLAVLAAGLATTLSGAASAAPIVGGPIIVTQTGNVVATFVGSNARFKSELGLVGGPSAIFSSLTDRPGTSFDLGVFDAGTVLTFYITVLNTGEVFYTGSGTANPDMLPHASVSKTSDGTAVGFEDTLGGGDKDYNDLNFSFTNTSVAEPATWAMMIVGFGLVGGTLRRRTRQHMQVSYS